MSKALGLCWLLLLGQPLFGQDGFFQFSHPQMGTEFSIQVYTADSSLLEETIRQAWDTLDRLNQILSDYLPGSDLNRFCRESPQSTAWQLLNGHLWTVLFAAKQMAILSDGAFDPTVGPLSRLWRKAFRRQVFPDSQLIEKALKQVDFRALRLGAYPHARLDSPLSQLDLGGIAKGYAVDVLGDLLLEKGFSCFLIDGGGDLRIGVSPPGKLGWRIQFPDGTHQDLSLLALATSGDRYRYLYQHGKRYSHLIDPRTGFGVSHGYAVSVEATSCTHADALASALSILGPDQGRAWLSSQPIQFFYPSKAVFYP